MKNSKIALITGSSKGIGNSIADYLLDNDYFVYINGRNLEKIKKLKKYENKNVEFIQGNLNEERVIISVLKKIKRNGHSLDLVVCNIGSGRYKPGCDFSIKEFRNAFDINFFNSVMMSKYAIEEMKKKGGHIVFISSIAGCESISAPVSYSTAKAALIAYCKNLSIETALHSIRINCISPGNVMFKNSVWDKKMKSDKKKVKNYIKENVPMNEFIDPINIAETVLFLDKNEKMTGVNIIIDGGQTRKLI